MVIFFMITAEMENMVPLLGPSWEEVIPGCTDPYAENYNENANSDDGSCFGYPDLAENAISFDGTDDYIDLGRPSDLNFTPNPMPLV